MLNYEVTKININDETISHIALFAGFNPTTFESIVKEELKENLDDIERNDTWDVSYLQKGHNY